MKAITLFTAMPTSQQQPELALQRAESAGSGLSAKRFGPFVPSSSLWHPEAKPWLKLE